MELWRAFDIIGIFVFLFLILDAVIDIASAHTSRRAYIRLLIGVVGLFVDAYLVFFF